MAELGVAVAGLGSAGRAGLRPLVAADDEDDDDGADHDRAGEPQAASARTRLPPLAPRSGRLHRGDDPEDLDDGDVDRARPRARRRSASSDTWGEDQDQAGERDRQARAGRRGRALRMAARQRERPRHRCERIDLLGPEAGGGREDQGEKPDRGGPGEQVAEDRVPGRGGGVAEQGVGDLAERERPAGDQDDDADDRGDRRRRPRPAGRLTAGSERPRSRPPAGSARGTAARSRARPPRTQCRGVIVIWLPRIAALMSVISFGTTPLPSCRASASSALAATTVASVRFRQQACSGSGRRASCRPP